MSTGWDESGLAFSKFWVNMEQYPELRNYILRLPHDAERVVRGYDGYDVWVLWEHIEKNEHMHDIWITLHGL